MLKNSIIVATDGSAINNPKGPGGWAWYVDADRWNAGSMPMASNQVMEMSAILRALIDIPQGLDLTIQTDSAFCVNMIGRNGSGGWMEGWKKRDWRKADGKEPSNLLLVKKLDEVLLAREGRLEFEWVKGHADHHLNQMADRKCRDASFSQKRGEVFPGGPGWVDTQHKRISNPATPARTSPTALKKPSEKGYTDPFNYDDDTAQVGTLFKNIKTAKAARASQPLSATVDRPTVMRKDEVIKFEEYCPSCDRPINLITGECACSI